MASDESTVAVERGQKTVCPRCGDEGFATLDDEGTVQTSTMEFSKLCHGEWGVFFHP